MPNPIEALVVPDVCRSWPFIPLFKKLEARFSRPTIETRDMNGYFLWLRRVMIQGVAPVLPLSTAFRRFHKRAVRTSAIFPARRIQSHPLRP